MAYTHKRLITIDHTKVSGTADFTNFPILVSGTYTYLKTIANGGKVTNSSGFDIVFRDMDGSRLDHEIERYIATTGEVIFWVKIPVLKGSSPTDFWMYYGDPSVSTTQENKTAVWSNGYQTVSHLPDGTTLTTNDSSPNANHATVSAVTVATGNIGGGASGAGAGYITHPNIAAVQLSTLSMSTWYKGATPGAGYRGIWGKQEAFMLFLVDSILCMYDWGGGFILRSTGVNLATGGNWHHIHVTMISGSTNNTLIYIDGALSLTTTVTNYYQGYTLTGLYGGPGQSITGTVDEQRLASVIWSADHINTDYNSQSSPSTFYSIGGEQSPGSIIINKGLRPRPFVPGLAR